MDTQGLLGYPHTYVGSSALEDLECLIKTCSDVKNHASSNHINEASTYVQGTRTQGQYQILSWSKAYKSKQVCKHSD